MPFARQFAPDERVRDLDRQLLEAEGSGILNWCIAGCLHWQKIGLQVPPSILQETAMYRDDTDVIGDWLATECDMRRDARCSIATIFASYQNHIATLGMTPMTRPAFVRMMGTRGFRRLKSNGKSYLLGIDVSFGDL
jgi:putative DNA primase/helicase